MGSVACGGRNRRTRRQRRGRRGSQPSARTSGGGSASVANVIKEISTSKLVKQLEDITDELVGNGADEGVSHADVWFMPFYVSPQVLNPECLEGGLVRWEEWRVCLHRHKKGTGKAGVV